MNDYIELMERTLSEWLKEYPVEWIEQAYKNTVVEHYRKVRMRNENKRNHHR